MSVLSRPEVGGRQRISGHPIEDAWKTLSVQQWAAFMRLHVEIWCPPSLQTHLRRGWGTLETKQCTVQRFFGFLQSQRAQKLSLLTGGKVSWLRDSYFWVIISSSVGLLFHMYTETANSATPGHWEGDLTGSLLPVLTLKGFLSAAGGSLWAVEEVGRLSETMGKWAELRLEVTSTFTSCFSPRGAAICLFDRPRVEEMHHGELSLSPKIRRKRLINSWISHAEEPTASPRC